MLQEFWRSVLALLCGGPGKWEDPGFRTRERAVQAITQKNNLRQMAEHTQKRIEQLDAEARSALECGDSERAQRLWNEKRELETASARLQVSLARAQTTVEEIKEAIRREEERIRRERPPRWQYRWIGGEIHPPSATESLFALALLALILVCCALLALRT